MNDLNIQLLVNTIFWMASALLSIISLVWICKNVLPRIWPAFSALHRRVQSVYFDLFERRTDTSELVKEAKTSWLETRKRNEAMFDKKDRSRIRASFLETEHKELTYYIALKRKVTKKEKARLRELRNQIAQVNNA